MVFLVWAAEIVAQEMTPRVYWPAPKGTKVLISGYSYATGDILFDQSIPIKDADSRINSGVLAYLQTINLWGRTSNILISLPYAWGTSRGFLEGDQVQRDFNDFGDISATLTVNLSGAPTMTKEDFLAFRANPHPLVGASVKVTVPSGQYDADRLVNVGANRWATKLKLGAVFPLKTKWIWEVAASASYFGDNDEFVTGKKEQKPIFAAESSLIKRIRPGFWVSLDLTYFSGGRQTIDGEPLRDYQKNLKIGGTLVIPFKGRHAIKVGYANGLVTRYGNDFEQILLTYQQILR
jgi:hypothetical protein